MFHEGLPATDAMKLFAEEGDISGLAVRSCYDTLPTIFYDVEAIARSRKYLGKRNITIVAGFGMERVGFGQL